MGIYTNNGVVFTAATTDWTRLVATGDPSVEKITVNVVCRLGCGEQEHPAVQAWKRGYSKRAEPSRVQLLREGTKSCIYRLEGVGPGGTSVIGKRCREGEARIEQTIYQEVLPYLPISSLIFYGVIDEPGTEFRWLFLEDAGGEEFAYSIEKHRRLAAHWLGQMHVSAARLGAVSCLPDRGPQHYLVSLSG